MKEKLSRAMLRSELAYQHYLQNKRYFQALRIYKANESVYEALNEYLFSCHGDHVTEVINYIFHLEDWFNQFEQASNSYSLQLEDEFIFERLEGSIPFPRGFIELLA